MWRTPDDVEQRVGPMNNVGADDSRGPSPDSCGVATIAIYDLQIRVPELVHRTSVFQMAGSSEGMDSGMGESTNYHGNHRTVAGRYREVRPMPRDYDARKGAKFHYGDKLRDGEARGFRMAEAKSFYVGHINVRSICAYRGSRKMLAILPRKWPLLSVTPKETTNKGPEQCNAQKCRHPNCMEIKVCSSISKQIYSGDRFLPSRRGYNFDMAHYLLMKEQSTEKTNIIDVCKQVDSLEDTFRRKALRAIMIEQVLIPALDQDKILRFSGSMVRRPRKPPRSEYEKKESWKCVPRKKILIGSAEKMLSIPEDIIPLQGNIKAMDWNCNNMMAVSNNDCLNIYNNDGEKVTSIAIQCSSVISDVNQITDIKWASDGNKLIMSVCIPDKHVSMLVMYDLKKQKILWDVMCKCWLEERGCTIRCICWSAYDRQIVTGCAGRISIFDADTGMLLRTKLQHTKAEILNLSFSPNYKYLVSTAEDKNVRLFSWSELTPCFNIRFFKPVKAVAWHPQMSGLLCIGGRATGSLSLWNVNKCVMTAFVRAKFSGRVENLAWNKLSGELVVHWTYKEEDNVYTIVAVLASFNRIVDVLPLDKDMRLCFMKFNAAHEQLSI
ncbi:Protein cortex [Cyphomyrmex costatus]|uniref:Protein cortex n=1 Tax=Cyphomyrmex costatus TaxID=456900 RepID=A0A195CLF8_9HYME|nr:Protein cortex [Cyphomyrmex costatus]